MRFGPVCGKNRNIFSENGAEGVKGRSEIFRKFIRFGEQRLPYVNVEQFGGKITARDEPPSNGLSLILNSDLMRLRPKRWASDPQSTIFSEALKKKKKNARTNKSSTETWDNLRGICLHSSCCKYEIAKMQKLFSLLFDEDM